MWLRNWWLDSHLPPPVTAPSDSTMEIRIIYIVYQVNSCFYSHDDGYFMSCLGAQWNRVYIRQMALTAGHTSSGAADADHHQSSCFSCSHNVVIADGSTPTLTYEIVGLSDVIVPHGHLQRLFGEVCIFDIITELLQGRDKSKRI